MPNRLSFEKSPYLLQHANNPVDWYPWGEEAFERAKAENKPIFLSIGYATCHWCHVMEHESFEDKEVARVLSEHVIAVKVDREERPDIDEIYMTVCQALTGSGGWPLSIFMTPDRKPFFAGTYFPRTGRLGMPGFIDVVLHIASLWENQRDKLFKLSEEITGAIQPRRKSVSANLLDRQTLEKGYLQLRRAADDTWGGFGTAPKFPTPHHLTFLLRWSLRDPKSEALSMVGKTLNSMRNGGIFDQIGYGFHRYSVDERWLVPHFEKMLYDQAMLAMAYTEAFLATGNLRYSKVTEEIFEYVLRDMTDPQGGFYSAEDADSEGKEGLFYVWTPKEIKDVLGEDAGEIFCRFYDISDPGNFEEGRSIPHITRSIEAFARQVRMNREDVERVLEDSRLRLFHAREKRIHPLKDDKILTAWNGLMIAALAKGYQVLGNPRYLQAASSAVDFILKNLRRESGRLYRRYRDGDVANPGYLEDYAFFVWGLIELYEAGFDTRHLERAVELSAQMLDLFWDENEGGFFYTGTDGEALIVRDKQIYDGAIPSGNSVGALNLLRLARMTGNTVWEEKADRLFKVFSGTVGDYPSAYTQFLNAVDFALGPGQEIVITGDIASGKARTMVDLLHRRFSPNRVMLFRKMDGDGSPLDSLCDYAGALLPMDPEATVYVCENFACKRPITELSALQANLL